MKLYESSEDYLERILILKNKFDFVRSIDIAEDMSFSKASVSVAMKKLRENGYIIVDTDGFITLTKTGHEVASRVYERHLLLTEAFKILGVPENIARADACKIEHDLSKETFDAIKNAVNKIKNKPLL